MLYGSTHIQVEFFVNLGLKFNENNINDYFE